jgi:hypothetical protein
MDNWETISELSTEAYVLFTYQSVKVSGRQSSTR